MNQLVQLQLQLLASIGVTLASRDAVVGLTRRNLVFTLHPLRWATIDKRLGL